MDTFKIAPECFKNPITCQVVDMVELVVNVTRWLFMISIPVAVALFLYGGYLIMTSGGAQDRVGQGRKVITTAVIGFVIVMVSWLVIRTIFSYLAPAETGGLVQ